MANYHAVKRYCKKRSHRKVRRSEAFFQKGNCSNKLYDYKWEIY